MRCPVRCPAGRTMGRRRPEFTDPWLPPGTVHLRRGAGTRTPRRVPSPGRSLLRRSQLILVVETVLAYAPGTTHVQATSASAAHVPDAGRRDRRLAIRRA